jgi:hypothetical protein
MYYVYRHIREDKNEPFYVGASFPEEFDGYKRANTKHSREEAWYKVANETKFRVEILVEDYDKETIIEAEKFFITLYGKIVDGTGSLVNVRTGGHIPNDLLKTKKTRVENCKTNRKIVCINDGNTFNSITEAAKFYILDRASVSKMCKGEFATVSGYIFKYGGSNESDEKLKYKAKFSRNLHTSGKEVRCIEDGQVFENMTFAAKHYGIDRSDISRAVKFKRKTKGLSFEVVGENVDKNNKIRIKDIDKGVVYDSMKDCCTALNIHGKYLIDYFKGKIGKRLRGFNLIKL